MKYYVIKALHKLQRTFPTKPQHAPHKWTVPIYGKNRQFTPDPDKFHYYLNKASIKYKEQLELSCIMHVQWTTQYYLH